MKKHLIFIITLFLFVALQVSNTKADVVLTDLEQYYESLDINFGENVRSTCT